MRINTVLLNGGKVFWTAVFIPIRRVGHFLDYFIEAPTQNAAEKVVEKFSPEPVLFMELENLRNKDFSVEGIGQFRSDDLIFLIKNVDSDEKRLTASAGGETRELGSGEVTIFEFTNQKLVKY